MTTVNSTIFEIIGIVDRSRGHGSGQNKAVIGVNRGMFFEPIMRRIFLNNPVRVQIAMEFKRFAVFIKFAFRRIMLISGLLDFVIADRPTGGFNESGINGNAFIDSEALGFKLTKNFGVDLIHGFFCEPCSKTGEC